MTETFDAAPKSGVRVGPCADVRDSVQRAFVLLPEVRRGRAASARRLGVAGASLVDHAALARRRAGSSAAVAEVAPAPTPAGLLGARLLSPRRAAAAVAPVVAPDVRVADAGALVDAGAAPAAHRRRPSAAARKLVVGEKLYPAWRAYWKDGTDVQRNVLVEAYQDLVREIAGRFAVRLPRSVDRGDLSTAANFGLIAAITSFDGDRGVRFEAYADRRIRGALLDELRCQDWLPRPWRQRFEQHKRAVERLRASLGRPPQDHEVAQELDLSMDEYLSTFGTGLLGAQTSNRTAEDSDEAAGVDLYPDPRADPPDDRLTRDELMGLVAERLTGQEFRIVYFKYWEDLPMRVIGELTGLSESRVCKIHTRLIARLRDRLGVEA
jgi:RNA polymerase sigma factor for flagellar operon FliA